ncbi:MAG: hypothetical protein DMF06_04810 [Verrucomicrobia bacterium]|nr:MAG: hypothetical protein DMF06_04810 [Verrucomicrobiota bacterium]
MLRGRRWQLRRGKLDVVYVLALRRVELHVSLFGSQEAQDFHILRFFFCRAALRDAAFVF